MCGGGTTGAGPRRGEACEGGEDGGCAWKQRVRFAVGAAAVSSPLAGRLSVWLGRAGCLVQIVVLGDTGRLIRTPAE